MEINLKLITNFTVQLKFMIIVVGIMNTTIGAFGISDFFLFFFIVISTVLGITGILFVGSIFDILKESDALRKLERNFHIGSGILIDVGALIYLLSGQYYWGWGGDARLCSIIIGLLLNAPLHFLMGWQLYGTHNREPEQFRPLYLFCSVSHHRMKHVEDVPPPRYSDSLMHNRQKYAESAPIVELPPSHSRGGVNMI